MEATMNLSYLIPVLALSVSAFTSHATAGSSSKSDAAAKTEKSEAPVGYKEINAHDLKSMIDSKSAITILDARKKLSGGILPGAKNLPYDANEKDMAKTLGSLQKNATIIVYCANINCPVSKYLAERLVTMGYTNVYKYPEGIQDWIDKGLTIEPIKHS
jgi:Rhodanese-related sulfurtransferase